MAQNTERLLGAINRACEIIELGDQRLLASDGPAGGQPPDISLAEWRELYSALNNARRMASAAVAPAARETQETNDV